MGFGDFMSGMQGGMSAMDNLKNSRLKRKLYDQAISEADADFTVRNERREKGGFKPFDRYSTSDTLIGKLGDKLDPVLTRFMESIGRGSGATESPTAGALPTAGEMAPLTSLEGGIEIPELDPSQFEAPEYEFARGTPGGVDDAMRRADELSLEEDTGPKQRQRYNADSPEEIAKRSARARAATPPPTEAIPTQVIDRSADKTLGQRAAAYAKDKATYKGVGGPSMTAAEGAGALRTGARKVVGGLGRGAIIGSIIAGGSGGIRGALDAETTGDGFWSDVGQRAVGAGKGVVAGVLDPLGEPGRWMDRGEEEAPAAAPEAAPAEALPTSGPKGPRRYPGQGAARRAAPGAAPAPAGAIPTTPAEANPLDGFDVRKVSADQVPNFSNQDWVGFREEMLSEYMRDGKMSYAEAWDKVDQQVVATQQRGFLHFGNQARALLGSGDLKGAATAVRAAFQYMPTTTDLQVGVFNGHLVAFGVDEETGEQVGSPMVITPEFLDSALMNFSDRKAWQEHAQDNRKLDQADRELGQGDKRLQLMERATEIDAFNAETQALRYGPGGGGDGEGGMKLSDADRHTQFWQDQSFAALNAAGIQDPDLQGAMSAVMSSLYAEDGGQTRPEVIARQVSALAKTEEGRARILAAASQLAGG